MTSRKYPLPKEELRSEIVMFRMTPDEKAALRETAERMDFDDISEFVRFWITDLIKTKGKGIKALSAIGQMSTSGAQRVQGIDFVPELSVFDAETGDPVLVDVVRVSEP